VSKSRVYCRLQYTYITQRVRKQGHMIYFSRIIIIQFYSQKNLKVSFYIFYIEAKKSPLFTLTVWILQWEYYGHWSGRDSLEVKERIFLLQSIFVKYYQSQWFKSNITIWLQQTGISYTLINLEISVHLKLHIFRQNMTFSSFLLT